MRRHDTAGGTPVKTLRRKRRNTAKVARRRKSSTADATDRIALLTLERDEALEQQRATSEVLKVISSSPGELEPVFKAMLESALRICEAEFGMLMLHHSGDGSFDTRVMVGAPPALVDALLHQSFTPPPGNPLDRMLRTKKTVHVVDAAAETAKPLSAQLAGARSHISVPMVKQNEVVGAISIYRTEVRPFSDKQIELVTNFAAQAVIAIENTRLLHELRESLQQQTATADVLKVIGRSAFDLQTVLDTLVRSAVTLSGACTGTIFQRIGDLYHLTASIGFSAEIVTYGRSNPIAPGPGSNVGRTALQGKVVQIPDVLADPDFRSHGYQRLGNFRAMLGVPLMRDGKVEGVFSLGKPEPGPFTQRQAELAQTFADQAIIAIENVRLFDELKARTEDLRESLQQQIATADVLKVISRSAFDLQTVLNTLLESAVRLCVAKNAHIYLQEADTFRLAACSGFSREYEEFLRQTAVTANRGSLVGRTVFEGKIVSISDVLEDPEYNLHDAQRLGGFRTMLGIPMVRDGVTIGVLAMTRSEPRPFTDKQIELVTTFADQAVIAIHNVRLFEEVQARTEDIRESLQQQTATADVLKVISRSTFDLQTVLQTLVESAARLSDAEKATITRQKDGVFFRAEAYGFSDEFMNYVRNVPVVPEKGSATGRALLEGVVVHIPDVQADPEYTFGEAQRLGDFRTLLGVPMMREGTPLGAIVLTRSEPRPFTDKQIELVTTFADQAAIAIENVRLFENVEARTQELAKSLDDLRTAQDRLVQTQKLASLGQLTAGIAHEIKNPLNFVNNFSTLSVELVDELDEVLKSAALDNNMRRDADELTAMLKSNLEKVVQHGKRADSIVKNMLLHSRESSGERRPVELNALVEESLNLAYHGARAEKQGFEITLERSFDPAVGEVDLFPQEITRVLLNLISNGFYAATKRKAEMMGGYEPALAAATRDLGDRVEIRIRDNGSGIPPEVKEKMFNPFFTTKPPGEGTGLGLSISHDIIVKQHGGSIEVDTQPGEFTEFRIVLPRWAATIAKSGERASR